MRSVEGVHLGFSFKIPDPQVHINSPGAIGEPEKDQLVGACKNWFQLNGWSISNAKLGCDMVVLDAPLMETWAATPSTSRAASQNPHALPQPSSSSSKIYSWAMNNHWHTNYRADQEGATWFRFAIQSAPPHRGYDPVGCHAIRCRVHGTVDRRARLRSDPSVASRLSL